MPQWQLNYDISLFYQSFVNSFYSIWPILAAAIGIALATLLLEGIVNAFRKFIEDHRG
ncbi:hypothetical protein MCACPph1_CDS0023 [Moorella phage MCACPph1]